MKRIQINGHYCGLVEQEKRLPQQPQSSTLAPVTLSRMFHNLSKGQKFFRHKTFFITENLRQLSSSIVVNKKSIISIKTSLFIKSLVS
jgi:hypothetical protein